MDHFLYVSPKIPKLSILAGDGKPSTYRKEPAACQINDALDRLPVVLQSTLDLDELIQLFEHSLRDIVYFDSLHYQYSPSQHTYDSGSKDSHCCHYDLSIDSSHFGKISFTRQKKFHPPQLRLIEDALCKLLYPLRNCLMYQQAKTDAIKDKLTGLNNRNSFDFILAREISLSHRQLTPLSLLIFDIDNFKAINDNYGHNSGDHVLKLVSKIIDDSMRFCDVAFRYGGEEFVLILNNTDKYSATLIAERIRLNIAQLYCEYNNAQFKFTVSTGVAQLCPEETATDLFNRADKALYAAKNAGRNQSICA